MDARTEKSTGCGVLQALAATADRGLDFGVHPQCQADIADDIRVLAEEHDVLEWIWLPWGRGFRR